MRCWLSGEAWQSETITALLGGVAAHQDAKFLCVVAAVALSRMIGDQLLYFLGLRFGPTLASVSLSTRRKLTARSTADQRHPYLFVIGTRFMYGFRIIRPVLISASHLPPKIFLPLNVIGACAWALIFTTLDLRGWEVIGPWLHNLTSI